MVGRLTWILFVCTTIVTTAAVVVAADVFSPVETPRHRKADDCVESLLESDDGESPAKKACIKHIMG